MHDVLIGLIGTLIGYLVSFSIERIKVANERGTHINQVRFDKEFEIYQELSEKNLTAVYDASETVLYVRGLDKDNPKKQKAHSNKLWKSWDDSEFTNKKYAPFIDKEIFQEYKELGNHIRDISTMFNFWIQNLDANFHYKGTSYTRDEAAKYIEEKQKIISDLSDSILDDVRAYLQKLDLIR